MPSTTAEGEGNRIVLPTQEEVDSLRGFKVGKWRGHDNYICLECQFSTLWLDKMKKHQKEEEHPWAYPQRQGAGQQSADKDELTY
jgi:hypothetical protein